MLSVMPKSTISGFTMIEMLVVVGIIAVLAAMLIPTVSLVRTKAKVADARQMVRELSVAVEAYRSEDPRKLYPPEADPAGSDPALWVLRDGVVAGVPQVLELLMERKLLQLRSSSLSAGVLLDPWRNAYRYTLRRPAAAGSWAGPGTIAEDWNWDAARSRTRVWNERTPSAEAPFPYIWSYGPSGADAPIGKWIYASDR